MKDMTTALGRLLRQASALVLIRRLNEAIASAAVVFVLLGVVGGAIAAGSNGADSSTNGAVTFVRGQQVYLLGPRGKSVRRLTRLPSGSNRPESEGFLQPAWSADGKRIAVTYSSNDPHEYDEIDVMRANGTGRHIVVDGGGDSYSNTYPTEPAWSPDGRQLVYRAGDFCTKLFVVDVFSRSAHPVTPGMGCPDIQRDTQPAWSPDGSQIAFVRSRVDGGRSLYTIHPDGRALRRLTRSYAAHPDWSPDGSRIAFDDGRRTLVLKVGSKQAPAPLGPGIDPAWSPDGRKILVVRGHDLWVMDSDGNGKHLLVRDASQPDWQPSP
jgi:Tol biopolymer transport system component